MPNAINNWYVVTGGPGCGKTTTVNILKKRGYKTTIEHARHYIDTLRVKGKTVAEIRKNQLEFQLAVLAMQLKDERALKPKDIVFLDRALPDALAYCRFLKLRVGKKIRHALRGVSYKKAFILDPLPLKGDYARTETPDDQRVIHDLIVNAYFELGIPVVRVPVMPQEKRVDFVLANLD